MNPEARSTSNRHGGDVLGRLRARVSDRLARRVVRRDGARQGERGDALVETIVFMAVIAVTIGAFTVSAQSTNQVQRQSLATDVVDQQITGVIEQAKSQPWALLGFASDQDGFRDKDGLGRRTARLTGPADSTTDRLTPTEEVSTRDVEMTLRVDIAWESGTPAAVADPATYGTKVVTVTITYRAIGSDVTRTKTESIKRTASVSESLPPRVGGLGESSNRRILPRPATSAPAARAAVSLDVCAPTIAEAVSC